MATRRLVRYPPDTLGGERSVPFHERRAHCAGDGQSEAYCTELSVTDGENIRGIYGLVDFDLDIDAACPAESLHLDCIRIRYVPLFDAWCPLPTEWWFARDVGLVGFTDAWGTWAVVDPAT